MPKQVSCAEAVNHNRLFQPFESNPFSSTKMANVSTPHQHSTRSVGGKQTKKEEKKKEQGMSLKMLPSSPPRIRIIPSL